MFNDTPEDFKHLQKLFKMKYAGLLLVTVAIAALSGPPASAATANGNVVVTVAAAASISVTSSVTLTPPGVPFTGNYTGNSTITFSLRTTPTTGAGSITLQGLTDFAPVTGGDVGPKITSGNLTYTCPSGGLTGGGSLVGTLSYCGTAGGATPVTVVIGTPTNVLTAIGAKSHATNATLPVVWSVPDSASYDVDSYTAVLTFTISAT